MPDEVVQCVVTSPPYWGLRDYGVDGQMGLETTPEEYITKMVEVFHEVKRVLRKDGTLWLNIGDNYIGGGRAGNNGKAYGGVEQNRCNAGTKWGPPTGKIEGLKQKDLAMMPARLAIALQADGWWIRSDIIWHKLNPMPESCKDRPTSCHEHIFLLTKSPKYYYDADAIAEKVKSSPSDIKKMREKKPRIDSKHFHTDPGKKAKAPHRTNIGQKRAVGGRSINGNIPGRDDEGSSCNDQYQLFRNKRNVWVIPSRPYSEAHFATYPPELILPCILAGTSAKGCCPSCGAPWERIIEGKGKSKGWHDHVDDIGKGQSQAKENILSGSDFYKDWRAPSTIGWGPSCLCGGGPVPCIVLDPFLGSGTTLEVCRKNGRIGIGFELNPEYESMIRKRSMADTPIIDEY